MKILPTKASTSTRTSASTAAITICTPKSRATSCCSNSTTPVSCGTRGTQRRATPSPSRTALPRRAKCSSRASSPSPASSPCGLFPSRSLRRISGANRQEKVKFLQLAQEIAGRHSLTLETYGITDQTYDYVEQNNLADFAFFQNRCTLEGAAFLVYDGKLVVYDEAYMESQQPVDTITITPANDFEYRDEGTNAYGSAEAVNGGLTGTFKPNGGDKVLRDPAIPHDRPERGRPLRQGPPPGRQQKRDRRHPLDGLAAARLCGGICGHAGDRGR